MVSRELHLWACLRIGEEERNVRFEVASVSKRDLRGVIAQSGEFLGDEILITEGVIANLYRMLQLGIYPENGGSHAGSSGFEAYSDVHILDKLMLNLSIL